MSTAPILHHFEGSPFAEKVRAILGAKRMAWRSVLVPMAMPKPDLIALTGGYRKTPNLQIGADIYCDTALIAQVIDELQPEPPLIPAGAAMAPFVAAWADSTLFWVAIMNTQAPEARARIFQGLTAAEVQHLRDDRTAFTATVRRPAPADAAAQFRSALGALDQTLARQPWLLGTAPSIADFSVYHCVWFTVRAGVADALLASYPAVRAWYARIVALGHGQREDITSSDAIAICAAAKQRAAVRVDAGLGLDAGDVVTVGAIDYGLETVSGTLVGLTIDRVTIERRDPRAGTVHVHFPRSGFQVHKTVE